MILADSSVWIDFLRGAATPQALTLRSLLGTKRISVGDLIVAEVLQGCVVPRQFSDTLRLMSRLNLVTIGGHEVAVEAARKEASITTDVLSRIEGSAARLSTARKRELPRVKRSIR